MLVEDINNVDKILKVYEQLERKIEIGIFGKSGGDVLMIAVVNEFGIEIRVTEKMRKYLHANDLHLKKTTTDIKIPERSFVRKTYDTKKQTIKLQCEKKLVDVINLKESVSSYHAFVGELCTAFTRRTLTSLRSPKNHPYTVEKKNSSNPLINTGRLRESITWRVV